MMRFVSDLAEKSFAKAAVTALILGALGFGLNMLEMQLGWGMHFVFGNALIFAFLRILNPATVIAAASISSLWTIWLWNHPWAWLVWTLEAVLLSLFVRRATPIRTDVIFWLLLGAPLLVATYGGVMEMDRLSLWLVIAKQATNGILNVVLGELLYGAILAVFAIRKSVHLPRMSVESFVLMILSSIILIPTTVYLALDAPARQAGVREAVAQDLNNEMHVINVRLGMWHESRSLLITTFVRQAAWPSSERVRLPAELSTEFERIETFDRDGRLLSSTAPSKSQSFGPVLRQPSRTTLIEIPPRSGSKGSRLALLVPTGTNANRTYTAAWLRPGVLEQIALGSERKYLSALLLLAPSQVPHVVHATSLSLGDRLELMPGSVRQAAREKAALFSVTSFGAPLMSDLRDALMVRAVPIRSLTGWEAVGFSRLNDEVLKARQGQAQLFMALTGFVLLVSLLGIILAKRLQLSLRHLAQSAADLALMGTKPDKIDSLVISELNDLSISIATAGSRFAQERGALVTYQRRLRSIAEHAPILVYALEIVNNKKGVLLYVSDAIHKILGYSPDEIAQPGWWVHAIHPDDCDHCLSAFADLQPGKIIHLEYRLRHKDGHYIWIYDNLAVESDPVHGKLEAVGLLIDISERKHAAELLVHADRMTSLGRMVAGVAHEINQPLNFIKMAAMNLRERTNRGLFEPERFNSKLENIISHVNRASAIILQMRIFGRTPTEAPHPMAIKEAVKVVLEMVEPQLEADGVSIEWVDDSDAVMVRALPVLLEQVLLNLVLNARDAIRTRQQIDHMHDGVIRVTATRQSWQAVITVEDNGTGIPADVLPILFEPFFTTKPPKEGTGLGLSISYGIIRDLGGTIRAENTPAGGARFIIELPIVG